MMVSNIRKIERLEKSLKELQQVRPVNVDDLDLSRCPADTRETVINSISEQNKLYDDIVYAIESTINDLKRSDGDV